MEFPWSETEKVKTGRVLGPRHETLSLLFAVGSSLLTLLSIFRDLVIHVLIRQHRRDLTRFTGEGVVRWRNVLPSGLIHGLKVRTWKGDVLREKPVLTGRCTSQMVTEFRERSR